MPSSRPLLTITALAAVGVLTAGCTLLGGADDPDDGVTDITLAVHDSWAAPQSVLDEFERQSGVKINVQKQGDAGELTNKLVLSKASPVADVAFGVDSTFASRALSEGVFAPYTSPEADKGPQRFEVDPEHRLSAVDHGDVCLNVDTGWFAENGLDEPASYEDLVDPKYKDLTTVESPATSSPGLAFLLGTVAKFGADGWQDYWSKLKENGVQSVSSWSEAYSQQFSGSSGKGPRPIVVSYASSPVDEVGEDGKPRTKALLNTCYRQVEYAGVVAGAKHPDQAQKVVDFLLSQQFQATVADNMYVYPVRESVDLPPPWQQAAPQPEQPASLPSEQIEAGRQQWIEQWRALFES